MANPVRQTAVLGDQNQPEAWPDMEVVRNSQTQVENQMAAISRGRDEKEPMSENTNGTQAVSSTSILNQVVEAVASLINALSLYASISRGALGTGDSLTCEVGPTGPSDIWLDKNKFIPVDLTINGKHSNLQTLSDALNTIHESLTMMFDYPTGDKWQITDIATLTEPQVIGREQDNRWMMASALIIKVATLTPEPAPAPEPDPVPEPDNSEAGSDPDPQPEQAEE